MTLFKRRSRSGSRRGLDLTANYTFSKNLATAEDQDGTTIPTNDVFNRRLNKTLSRNDQPHIFVVAFNYIVPGWNRTSLVRHVTGGWTVGGILRYASGTPIQVPGANNSLSSVFFQGHVCQSRSRSATFPERSELPLHRIRRRIWC